LAKITFTCTYDELSHIAGVHTIGFIVYGCYSSLHCPAKCRRWWDITTSSSRPPFWKKNANMVAYAIVYSFTAKYTCCS